MTDTMKSASYLDLHVEIDGKGKLLTKLTDKRDDFAFRIVNFPFICGNSLSARAYGFFISQHDNSYVIPKLAVKLRRLFVSR